MRCIECEDRKTFTQPVIEITNPEQLVLFRKVLIPVSMGDETIVPPTIGKYKNVLLQYEANSHLYLYSSDGIPTRISSDAPADIEERLEALSSSLSAETVARQSADLRLQSLIDAISEPIEFTPAEWNTLWM